MGHVHNAENSDLKANWEDDWFIIVYVIWTMNIHKESQAFGQIKPTERV